MRTGRLSIARGNQFDAIGSVAPEPLDATPAPDLATVRVEAPASAPEVPVWHPQVFRALENRLNAIERLARLHQEGLLSAEEFATEKALLRGVEDPAPEIDLARSVRPAAGPSLLGRIIRWPVLGIGLAAGLALSAASQPELSRGLLDETLRLIGA